MKRNPENPNQSVLPLDAPRPAPATITAGQFLANKDRLFRWCMAGLFLSGVVNVLLLVLVLQLAAQPPWFFALDSTSNIYVGQGTRFAQARPLHVQQAIEATSILLYRTQNDFDFPERLPDLFAANAVEAANRLKDDETQEFQDKALSQKAHVARVEALDTRPDLVRVAVSGKVARTGVFHNQRFTEVLPFRLILTFSFNPDLLRRGRFPTLVQDFQLHYEKTE